MSAFLAPQETSLDADTAKRRLSLARMLIWAEAEALDIGRYKTAASINLAIQDLYRGATDKTNSFKS